MFCEAKINPMGGLVTFYADDLLPSVTVESRETESEMRLTLSVSVLSKLSALVVCRAGGGMELADMVSYDIL